MFNNLDLSDISLPNVTWTDILDISVLYFLFYGLIVLIKGTRSAQITIGFVVIAITYYLAKYLELAGTSLILENLFSFLFVILVVLFQSDIRNGLAQMGRTPFLRDNRHSGNFIVPKLVNACTHFAKNRVGALIVLEAKVQLKNYTNGAVHIDSLVSSPLLVSIFAKTSPIHDGAVIIDSNARILAAGCILPLSANIDLSKQYGTRHRAALGISEECDAGIIVISEETGLISFVENNEARTIQPAELQSTLDTFFSKI